MPEITAPPELVALRRWLVWRAEERNGKLSKIPYRADGAGRASSTDAATWCDLLSAQDALPDFDGLGIALGGGLAGVDLDHCVVDDRIAPWAEEIIAALDSYAEFSPSGTGVHVLLGGKLTRPGNRRDWGDTGGHVEVYGEARYFTVTGEHVPGTPVNINPRQEELDALHRMLFPDAPEEDAPAPVATGNLTLTANAQPPEGFAALIANDEVFAATWAHKRDAEFRDTSCSAYDLALANIGVRAGWSDQEIANLLIAHRRTQGADLKLREDYYQRTISKARAGQHREAGFQGDLAPGDEEGRQAVIAGLCEELDMPLTDVEFMEGIEPLARFHFGDLGVVEMPIADVLSAQVFKRRVYAVCYRPPRVPVGKGAVASWDRICTALGAVARHVRIGEDATRRGETVALLAAYLDRWPAPEVPPKTAVEDDVGPFVREGRLYLRLDHLRRQARHVQDMRVDASTLAQRLKALGAESVMVHCQLPDKAVKRLFWALPLAALEREA